MTTTPNRLASEPSPYLQQHADNPVDWYPWGPEALERARREDRPILLSIGYSACHWCHVMAHESFEDGATAALMNQRFVNIKVDREERPDLDRIYQHAHQILARRPGGWPLTVFLTPDQIPFFTGTYYPPEPRHGLPAFGELLERVAEFYRDHREAIEEQNDAIRGYLRDDGTGPAPARLNDAPVTALLDELAKRHDAEHGGFGAAPKFPHVANLAFLLGRRGESEPARRAHEMALNSLHAMAGGGLLDQLGGGFYRYSVDAQWIIPHFEKMLYDNGPLLELYARAWRLSGDSRLREVAERCGEWLLREMQGPDGGYYASVDADSDGGEGAYYLWDPTQMAAVLEPQEMTLATTWFGLQEPPNFEGRWHLQARQQLNSLAEQLGLSEQVLSERLENIRHRLLTERQYRSQPGVDHKRLTAWNALTIRGMAVTGRALGRTDFIASAEAALDFIRDKLLHDGRLLATYQDGRARHFGYLDDYAYLIDAILALLEARWRDGDLELAETLADTLLEHFEDEVRGGFFFTADDHEALIQRPKSFMDESMPAGNGTAVRALLRLARLSGNLHYRDAAEKALLAAWGGMNDAPSAHAEMIRGLDEFLHPGRTVIVRAETTKFAPWQARLQSQDTATDLVLMIPLHAHRLPEGLSQLVAHERTAAYVCDGQSCSAPIFDPAQLRT